MSPLHNIHLESHLWSNYKRAFYKWVSGFQLHEKLTKANHLSIPRLHHPVRDQNPVIFRVIMHYENHKESCPLGCGCLRHLLDIQEALIWCPLYSHVPQRTLWNIYEWKEFQKWPLLQLIHHLVYRMTLPLDRKLVLMKVTFPFLTSRLSYIEKPF